jgi:hypothetical protein
MEQSPSWEADIRSVGQEIPRLQLNLLVHYRFHNSPSLNSILSQLNPVHVPTWPLTIREEHKLRIFENKVPNRILYLIEKK